MRTKTTILLVILLFLAIGVQPAPAGEEISREQLDQLTAIGPDAKAKMIELIELYENGMALRLRPLIERLDDDTKDEYWDENLRDISDMRVAWKGTAVDLYRGWAESKGADAKSIKSLPSDWESLDESYAGFFEICQNEGREAFVALRLLVVDATAMNMFVFSDDVRLDDAELLGKLIDEDVALASQYVDAYVSGRDATTSAKERLKTWRDKLRNHRVAYENRIRLLDDIVKRAEKYTSGDNAPATRAAKVNELFDKLIAKVDAAGLGTLQSMEAGVWKDEAQKHIKFLLQAEKDWKQRIDPLLADRLFKGRKFIDGGYRDVPRIITSMIQLIDKSL